MLSRLGGFTPDHSRQAGDLPISLSVYRATFSAAFRSYSATETSTCPGVVDNIPESSRVILGQESSTKEPSAEHLPKESQPTGAVTLEERQPLLPTSTSADNREDPAEKQSALNSLEDPIKRENVDQESSRKGSPAEQPPTESQPTGSVTLGEGKPLLAIPLEGGKRVAEGKPAVNPLVGINTQQKPRLRLSLRPPPRVAYPETIDVELPDGFSNEHGNEGGWSKGHKQCHRFWRTEAVVPLPAGWNPNLLILRHQAPSRFKEISTRFRRVPPTLLRLPTELRLHIFRYLLKSTTPITNPRADPHGASEEKSIPTVHTPILRTCRRIYLEGSSILYQENTFRFTEWASWFSFSSSQFSIHQNGIRHLEIHTTVAERYCNRTVRVQGQIFQEMRIRGPTDWDWPFSLPWRFPNVRTLKLELNDFHRLPEFPPDNTPHFCPDPMTKQGRDALLTKVYVIRHIHYSCQTPRLRGLTVVGISNPKYLLMLEIHFLKNVCLEVQRYCTRYESAVLYLENRTGGRWETQSERAEAYWDLTHVCREKRIREGWQPESLPKDHCYPGLDAWHLSLLMWIRMRAAKHGPNDPPASKPPSILWTW